MDHGIRHQPDACRVHWFGCFEMENTCYSAHGFKPLCGIANGGNRFWGDSSDFASIPARTAIGQPLNRSKITQKGLNGRLRSEEHTSELQSLMRISYAVFC